VLRALLKAAVSGAAVVVAMQPIIVEMIPPRGPLPPPGARGAVVLGRVEMVMVGDQRTEEGDGWVFGLSASAGR
jgi:hypothetical protein